MTPNDLDLMAFKSPEQYRLTKAKAKGFTYIGKEVMDMISDETRKEDGYFFIPQPGKKVGGFFLCRSTIAEGWHVVAINIPSQGRTPTWEEADYVRRFFFDEKSVVWSFFPAEHTYINKYWWHIWQPVDEQLSKPLLPPIFQQYFVFRRAPFFVRLWRMFKKQAKELWTIKKKPTGKGLRSTQE